MIDGGVTELNDRGERGGAKIEGDGGRPGEANEGV